LAEAGWKDHDAQGPSDKEDGTPLQLQVRYTDKAAAEKLLTPFQESLRKIGIRPGPCKIQHSKLSSRNSTIKTSSWSPWHLPVSTFPNPNP
jgi:ABC-type transport system substrate-binding protein